MDVFFEREFYRTVFRQLKDKTVIFVSHRLSSVTACDVIVYMEQGRILEQGTHEYLMGLQGDITACSGRSLNRGLSEDFHRGFRIS